MAQELILDRIDFRCRALDGPEGELKRIVTAFPKVWYSASRFIIVPLALCRPSSKKKSKFTGIHLEVQTMTDFKKKERQQSSARR